MDITKSSFQNYIYPFSFFFVRHLFIYFEILSELSL